MIATNRFSTIMAGLLIAGITPVKADLVVLQYHHVSDSTPASTSTEVDLFQGQLDMIDELGLEVVALESGTRQALEGRSDDLQQIAITFDDAYDSVYETAKPLLEEKGYPYTVFVNTDAVGGNGYMTWEELEDIRDDEGVTIANHSKDHDHLVQRPEESERAWRNRIEISLDDAQDALENRLGVAPPLFAYPYGESSEPLEAMLSDRGWLGYGQQSGAIGSHSLNTRLPRFPMATSYGQLGNLKTKLTSKALPVDAGQLGDPVMDENPPTLSFQLPKDMDAGRLTCFASGQGKIEVDAASDGRVSVQSPSAFDSRRFRYNCTYPAGKGIFYWLSHQYLNPSQPED
ncbi:polysaccharide deacetylase family protein [Marinobacter sp. CHS3-4]|uniref:polysaccharide deacetylase family protein n=1 Tax=Marinobacter sp. CHS3-4 TaxID=3045174 RepID=UPI0024B4FBD9|nr:polysaccharide deacetylase family protein [Marinobacter sp. CHS3-4]MDI9245727.1 polysaccharide deacetylase family protein [Marinobacter sp. CHS3-4]